MKRFLIISAVLSLVNLLQAQTFISAENDTTLFSEYFDGRMWVYRQTDDFVVGMTNYEEKDDYGRYYQIQIFVKNLRDSSVVFNPADVTSILYNNKNDTIALQVYSYEQFMRKVKRAQNLAMILTGISAGMQAGMASQQTTYTTSYRPGGVPYTQVHHSYNYAASASANIASQTQMMLLSKMMEDDRKVKSQGYLKIETLDPDEGIVGYMNIKRKKGIMMTVYIPVGGQVFSFDWNIDKKKK